MPVDPARRLNEADAMFLAVEEAAGVPYAPLTVAVYEHGFDDPEALAHLRKVLSRLLPAMSRRIVRDRLSTALPRWVDVPGFDPATHGSVLPTPGDGSLRAILDWAADWAQQPMPADAPPWRTVYFEDVTIDGVPGRLVSVGQTHHAVIDGEGATGLAEHYLQWAPDGPLPALPPPVPPDDSTAWDRWKEGWALEGAKARRLARHTIARVRWAAAHPGAGGARARQLVAAAKRLKDHQGTVGKSPLLVRRSNRLRFDPLPVDLAGLKAGARELGCSVNDGFMAALSVGLHRWHRDQGLDVPELRTAMAISTRTEDQGHTGNEVIGVMLALPLCEDAALALKRCQEVSRAHREDRDVLWLLDRFRAIGNRLPRRLIVGATRRTLAGVDLQISNVQGVPVRYWVAGVENLRNIPFPVGGPSALSMILMSSKGTAELAVSTDPVAIPDPDALLARLREGFDAIADLARSQRP